MLTHRTLSVNAQLDAAPFRRVSTTRLLDLRVGQILGDQTVEHAVDPLAVAPVRLAPDALADEARALGVAIARSLKP